MKHFLITILIAFSLPLMASELNYYQNKDGKIQKITEADFKNCPDFVYRTMTDGVPPAIARRALSATLRGTAAATPKAAVDTLKTRPNACSYGFDSEGFQ